MAMIIETQKLYAGADNAQALHPSRGGMPLAAIAIGARSLVDVVYLQRGAQDNNPIIVAPGCPYIGRIEVGASMFGRQSTLRLASSGTPVVGGGTVGRSGMRWNGQDAPFQSAGDLPGEVDLYYGDQIPVIPVRRAPFQGYTPVSVDATGAPGGSYYFPVFGRQRLSINIIRESGTSIDWSIFPIDASTAYASVASGTVNAGAPIAGYAYSGPAYDWILVALSNSVGGGKAFVRVDGYDL